MELKIKVIPDLMRLDYSLDPLREMFVSHWGSLLFLGCVGDQNLFEMRPWRTFYRFLWVFFLFLLGSGPEGDDVL